MHTSLQISFKNSFDIFLVSHKDNLKENVFYQIEFFLIRLGKSKDNDLRIIMYVNYFINIFFDVTQPRTTDTQRELFFENPKLLGLGRQIGSKTFGAFGVFSADLSAPIFVL